MSRSSKFQVVRRASTFFAVMVTLVGAVSLGTRCTSFESGEPAADDASTDAAIGKDAEAASNPADGAATVSDATDATDPSDASIPNGGPCWPPTNRVCADRQACCLYFDGGGTCTPTAYCPKGFAYFECKNGADCPASLPFCCAVVNNADDGGVGPYESVIQQTCVAQGNCIFGSRACTSSADCVDAGSSCTPYSDTKYPPTVLHYCK